MVQGPVPRLIALCAGVAGVVALACAWPGAAQEGKGGAHGLPSVPGAPSLPGPSGGGSTPGGDFSGGLSGGVGGPSGALGGGPHGPAGRGGGGGGGPISPLSPSFGGGRGSLPEPGGPTAPGAGDLSGLSPIDARSGRFPAGGDPRRLVDPAREALRGGRQAPGRDDTVGGLRDAADDALPAVSVLTQARQRQARALIENHRDLVEADSYGHPVVRGEILALAPSPAVLARAVRAGFRVRQTETLPDLGLNSVVLSGPRGISAVEAMRRLRALDPAGQYDFNHIYQPGGVVAGRARRAKAPAALAPQGAAERGIEVGLVDGAVAARQPALTGSRIVQKAFAAGPSKPSPHATAVASLIAGHDGRFRGAAPGARLFVADVYGSTAAGGSAEAIVRALAWLAQTGAPVINISLVGPPNLLLEAGVKALVAKGRLVVAAVGNDGPAAAPLYPASYPGVVAVTGVDGHRRLLPEAGRASHVDFAAPGSEMAAAGVDGGFVSVRGTSFAAPIAAGLLARFMARPDPGGAQRAMTALGRQAQDAGPPGRDPLFGRGIVGLDLRTPPAEVRARHALTGP